MMKTFRIGILWFRFDNRKSKTFTEPFDPDQDKLRRSNADNLVELGVVASLARPGGNLTGSTRVDADFSAKRLELLKETLPKLSRLAVLSRGSLGGDQEELKEIQAAAGAFRGSDSFSYGARAWSGFRCLC